MEQILTQDFLLIITLFAKTLSKIKLKNLGEALNRPPWTFPRCELVKIVDADTLKFDIDLGFYVGIKAINIRLARIDAPEIRGVERPKGLESSEAVRKLFEAVGSRKCLVNVTKRGKYRWIGEVFLEDGTNLSDWLLQNGYAEQYE